MGLESGIQRKPKLRALATKFAQGLGNWLSTKGEKSHGGHLSLSSAIRGDPIRSVRRRLAALWASALQPSRVYLGLGLSFGLLILAANPPAQAPDEGSHFFRAFQLSEGTLLGERDGARAGGQLPAVIVTTSDTGNIAFHAENKMTWAFYRAKTDHLLVNWWAGPRRGFFPFANTVVAPPTSYLPQTLALALGRALGLGPLPLLYLARLFAFGASLALGYAALRCCPVYRWSMLMILLSPMSLYLTGSVAPDGVLVGAAFLLLALLLRLMAEPDRALRTGEKWALVLLAGLFSISKFVYCPLALLVLIFVWPRLDSVSAKLRFLLGGLVLCVIPGLLWSRAIVAIYVPFRTDVPLDPVAQFAYIQHAPGAFLGLMFRTIGAQWDFYYRWMVGVLGWGDTALPAWFYSFFGCALLGCVAVESGEAKVISGKQRLLFLGSALAGILLIFVAQYAAWNPPRSHALIEGIEGRYFLPLMPLLVLAFPQLPQLKGRRGLGIAATLAAGVGAGVCLWAVVNRYYLA